MVTTTRLYGIITRKPCHKSSPVWKPEVSQTDANNLRSWRFTTKPTNGAKSRMVKCIHSTNQGTSYSGQPYGGKLLLSPPDVQKLNFPLAYKYWMLKTECNKFLMMTQQSASVMTMTYPRSHCGKSVKGLFWGISDTGYEERAAVFFFATFLLSSLYCCLLTPASQFPFLILFSLLLRFNVVSLISYLFFSISISLPYPILPLITIQRRLLNLVFIFFELVI
jgi:hypothetical protein